MTSLTKPLKEGKLTKRFLMDLDEGLYLVSNIHPSPLKSIFAETVAARNLRESQWKRIVEVGANNRLCHVFYSSENYQEYYKGPIIDLLVKDIEGIK